MFGWCSAAASRDSRTNRSRKSALSLSPGPRNLSATRRPRCTCSARYTTPMPPRPSSRSMRNPAKRPSPSTTSLYGCQVELPVVAAHPAPRRILEPALLQQREAEPAADRVRRRVVDRRERVHEPVGAARAGAREHQRRRGHRDAAALERRAHRPADLVGRPAAPLALPEADRPGALPGRDVDDLEHARPGLLVALLALSDLLGALRTAEV